MDLKDFNNLQLDSLYYVKLFQRISDQSLSYHLYKSIPDYSQKRPLVIVAHGGAFLLGGRESGSSTLICKELAKRGYATASIEYCLKAINTCGCKAAFG
ncbi:hypothetical protein N9P97_02055 [Saprospiraceae bacterium]|nr:hypothetical protein [Saprospiraceae bacterium]